MATSSSCESNLAPTEFDLASSVESSSGLTVAVERCPLCDGSRRSFYCRDCVNGGLFVHSTGSHPERYREKSHKLELLQKERRGRLERVQDALKNHLKRDQKISEIEQCRERIKLLKKALAAAKEVRLKGKDFCDKQKRENYQRVVRGRRHEEKKRRICSYIETVRATNEDKQQLCIEKKRELAAERKIQVERLVQFIFQVEEVALVSETDSMAVSTVSALRDASHTAYVRGQWVYTDGSGEAQHRIVEPTLPCSGDYSAYNLWVAASQENGGNPDNSLRNPGHRISAGLCYASQMTAVLSHILDIRLPRKQPYSDFCTNEITERQFKHSVACLNQNILYLCFAQNVPNPEQLDPRNTLQNIVVLLSCPSLGRNSNFEIDRNLMASIEDSVILQEEDSDTGGGEDELISDWEQVTEDVSDMSDVPTRAGYSSTISNIQTMSYPGQPPEQLTASGFVTTAATSFMSLFRGGDQKS
ncbi:beclin 1-associated autophagy-related key regulator-like [Saccostrea echinata]|uniref:beclin 1-associated autophagy-related key regulator-like n=1 Tax=Saccostrea echinata TaxID=191078 RepID=UPI002A801B88|nr:beclin 1-associated autophagy-related key regulator-like [Saccostrea echinata]